MTEVCPVTYTENLSNVWTTADYPYIVSLVMSGMRACPHFPRGMVDRTVCTKAYIPYVLCIPSVCAWKDLGTDYGVYFFVFTEWHHRKWNYG